MSGCSCGCNGAHDQGSFDGIGKLTLAQIIDHTLLKPNAVRAEVEKLCEEARAYGFASVCVNPCWVPLCAELLSDSDVHVCTVIGFPLGATSTLAKAAEAKQAVVDGADELDMVINVGWLLDGCDQEVQADIEAVVSAVQGRTVKVILETGLLTKEQIRRACELSVAAGADFVKTCTGFSTGSATAEDIALMHEVVAGCARVKASGGVRTRAAALHMIEAGASRIGTSSGIKIVTGE